MITRSMDMVISNISQGITRRVLCVCTAGVLRSPTAAWVLSNDPWNFNTRSCGIDEHIALIPLSEPLVAWADDIVCMMDNHTTAVQALIRKLGYIKPTIRIHTLDIPDNYDYRQPELVEILKEKFTELFS